MTPAVSPILHHPPDQVPYPPVFPSTSPSTRKGNSKRTLSLDQGTNGRKKSRPGAEAPTRDAWANLTEMWKLAERCREIRDEIRALPSLRAKHLDRQQTLQNELADLHEVTLTSTQRRDETERQIEELP